MVPYASLCIPILVSAIAVFIVSSILHMVLPYHRSDYKPLPDEDKLLEPLRNAKLPRGLYNFPFCTPKDMKSPEKIEKFKKGPVGFLVLYPNEAPAMSKFLTLWFLFCLVVSACVGLIAARIIPPGHHRHHIVHIVGFTSFLVYGVSRLSDGVWKGQPWSNVIKEVIDGAIYGAVTGLTFAFLWPR
ncbi:MAG TPA: hypothetical protein VJR23_05200 [Candidatus Acidoferrales bacterium]|nr:hypothetical protein [Candidatus Acidoferrales bacterium]